MLAPMSNRSAALGVLVVFCWLVPASSALAWPSVDPEGHRTPFLGGRWTVALPESAAPAFVQPPPGQPVPRAEIDGLIMLETDEGHFALHATLLESTRPDDLAAAVRGLPPACATPTYGTIGERTDMVVERCTDVSPDGAFRPLIVFAVHPDGWVDRIEALVETTSPDDEAGKAAGAAYAEAVMATLVAALPMGGDPAVTRGTVELDRACTAGEEADALTFTLPEGWIAMRDGSSATTLLRMTHVVPLGTPRPMIAIQLVAAGTEPQRLPADVGTRHESRLAGESMEWLAVEQAGEQGVRRAAAEITIDCGGGSTYARAMSLSIGGPTGTLDDAQHIVETFAIRSDRGHALSLAPVSLVAAPEEAVALDAGGETEEDRAAERQGHFWSIAIGAGSLLLLGAALVMRSKTTRPK